MAEPEKHRGTVGADLDGARLDKGIAALFGDLSRTKARKVIGAGGVRVNGKRVRVSSREVHTGDRIDVVIDERFESATEPPPNVILEGEGFVVVYKRAGQLVQGTEGGDKGTLERSVTQWLAARSGVRRAGEKAYLVHRLDAAARGLLVVATGQGAARVLSEQLQDKSLRRTYWALVEGIPCEAQGTIDLPLGRPVDGRVEVDENGRDARSHWRVLRSYGEQGISLLEVRLETGRTHQIRAHLAAEIGAIVGDWRYGAFYKAKGLRLASVELEFKAPDGSMVSVREEPRDSFFSGEFGSGGAVTVDVVDVD